VFAEPWDLTKPTMADDTVREVRSCGHLDRQHRLSSQLPARYEKTDADLECAMQRIMYPLHRLTRTIS
jgi:hypothetical protein